MTQPSPPAGSLPRWPQFSLRTLLIAVAVCGVITAIMGKLGPAGSIALGWFLFLGAVHVCGNFWGSNLGQRHQQLHPEEGPPSYAVPRRLPVAPAAPSTRLRSTAQLGRVMFIASTAGAILAGSGATLVLSRLQLDEAGYSGVVVGGLSAAVIGGLIGFLASSFLAVFLAAWGQASTELRSASTADAAENR